MTSTEFEKFRQKYQDIEEKRKKSIKLFSIQPKTIKEEAYKNHHLHLICEEISNLSRNILEELPKINKIENNNPINEFYEKLNERINFHQNIPDLEKENNEKNEEKPIIDSSMNELVFDIKGTPHLSLFYDNERFQEWKRQQKNNLKFKKNKKKNQIIIDDSDLSLNKFSGEETYGKYLDLINLHQQYLQINKLNYLEFLELFINNKNLNFIPYNLIGENFLNLLNNYLISFIKRSKPFFLINEFINNIKKEFNENYINNNYNNNLKNFCNYCNKEYKNEIEYKNHLNFKSHQRKINKNKNINEKKKFFKKIYIY